MKSTAIVCAIAASALGFSSLSFAQVHGGHRDHRGEGRLEQREDRRQERREERREQRRDDRQEHRDMRHGQLGHYQQPRHHLGQFQERHHQGQFQERHYQQPQYQTHYPHGGYHQWSGHAPRFQRGDHLPHHFRQRQYYVNDWRAHRGLYAPPHGYHWVQADGGDYLLVALATGLIANLLLNQY